MIHCVLDVIGVWNKQKIRGKIEFSIPLEQCFTNNCNQGVCLRTMVGGRIQSKLYYGITL